MKISTKSKWLVISEIALFFLLLLAVLVPFFTGVSYRSPIIIQLSNLKQVGLALREYAADHGDHFPLRISDIPAGSIPDEMRQFHDPATREPHDWIYFSGRTTNDPEGTILAASPVETFHDRDVREHAGGDRIVVFVNDSAKIMREADFQKLLAVQRK
jgi:hypothetical protein